MLWCPYTDKEIDERDSTPEHIIPLALGGSNQFTIRVCKDANASVGSAVDGALANEFPIALRRIIFDARGHTNTAPTVVLKKSYLGDGSDPVQVTFGQSRPVIWDPRAKRELETGEIGDKQIKSSFKIDRFSRFRFMCKAALSTGLFVYGDEFRKAFRHNELRAGMSFTMNSDSDFTTFGLRVYDEFSDTDPADSQQLMLDKTFCGETQGSCVFVIPGEESVGFVFGVLGRWIGTLNVPADTRNLPVDSDHDLGHAIQIENGVMRRLSYRQLAKNALERRLQTKRG